MEEELYVNFARSLVWLRRDLRIADNTALAAAASSSREVVLAFNVDPVLLASGRVGAPLVQAFFDALGALRADLRARGSDLAVLQGAFEATLPAFAKRVGAQAVFFNEDYEPSAIARDDAVCAALDAAGIEAHRFLDHVVLATDDVRTDANAPYRVFTPYMRRWRDRYALAPRLPIASERAIEGKLLARAEIGATRDVPVPEEFGFASSSAYPACSEAVAGELLDTFFARGGGAERYRDERDFPNIEGTSKLSVQLRAGTIGIRTCFARAFAAMKGSRHPQQIDTWINELIWREFYQMILKEFPHVDGSPFVEAAQRLQWNDDRDAFARWCDGTTGYPIVDAAMRQLNTTGWMHNRLRMIVASFLTKDLLIDWRSGERYFEQHLADADLAQNNGGWQWASSTGTDAAPYFRIFNPILQSKKFDPTGAFIRRMLPELAGVPDRYIHTPWELGPLMQIEYPAPVVQHDVARKRALAAYEPVMGKKAPPAGAARRGS